MPVRDAQHVVGEHRGNETRNTRAAPIGAKLLIIQAVQGRLGRFYGSSDSGLRAAPLERVKVKITVKNDLCEASSATAYGVLDCEFDFDSHEVELLLS